MNDDWKFLLVGLNHGTTLTELIGVAKIEDKHLRTQTLTNIHCLYVINNLGFAI